MTGAERLELQRRVRPPDLLYTLLDRISQRALMLPILPQPATQLLVGTSAAGLGLVRWLKRRRARDHNRAA
jgi:hypothetical protein